MSTPNERIELAILAIGGDKHNPKACMCDPEVGAVPCPYCAELDGLLEARRNWDDLTALRARLAEVEAERDVALVNEREMASALRKQHDNYNHLTSKIDSWKERISAAQNRERAALAERDGADGACQKLKDDCEVLTQEIDRLTKDRDDWKAKHWKAHDDFHRQFLEMENLRQQVTSSTNALRNCALAASAGNTEQIAWIVESALTKGH